MSAFYNENAAYPAAWLRNLISAGLITPGIVDERSISDLEPSDLGEHGQAHFFAGIGGWSLALEFAGWPIGASVWTGSCPCQPFSTAGKRLGTEDDRHLWPAWFRLIRECRPPIIFGEQVASPAGLAWLDIVSADLESAGYAVGAADLCAAGSGAPHIRQRLFFVAHTRRIGNECWSRSGEATGETRSLKETSSQWQWGGDDLGDGSDAGHLGDSDRAGRAVGVGIAGDDAATPGPAIRQATFEAVAHGLMGHPEGVGRDGRPNDQDGWRRKLTPGSTEPWSAAEWIYCRDGKWRPHGPQSFPLSLAHGIPARVGRLRACGNAIVPQIAAQFIGAVMDDLAVRP